MAVYREMAATGRGSTIFLATAGGGGGASVLVDLAAELRALDRPPRIFGGSCQSGKYLAWADRATPRMPRPLRAPQVQQGGDALSAALAVGATIASLHPLGLVAQILKLGFTGWKLAEGLAGATPPPPNSPELLKLLLRYVARDGSAVCLIDRVDTALGPELPNLIRALAPEIATDLPILLLATLVGPAELGPVARDETLLLRIARDLTAPERRLAEWWALRPLDPGAIAAWLDPAEPDLVERLHVVTEGDRAWLVDLMDFWSRQGVVGRGAGRGLWRWQGRGDRGFIGQVKDSLERRLGRLLGTTDPVRVGESIGWRETTGMPWD